MVDEKGMIETFFLIYGIVMVAGSWLMLKGVAEAPVGFEDEEGFHYAAAPAKAYWNETDQDDEDDF